MPDNINIPAPPETLVPVKPFFRVSEVAELLACSEKHAINLCLDGTLQAVDLRTPAASRSMIRIRRDSLVEYLRNHPYL